MWFFSIQLIADSVHKSIRSIRLKLPYTKYNFEIYQDGDCHSFKMALKTQYIIVWTNDTIFFLPSIELYIIFFVKFSIFYPKIFRPFQCSCQGPMRHSTVSENPYNETFLKKHRNIALLCVDTCFKEKYLYFRVVTRKWKDINQRSMTCITQLTYSTNFPFHNRIYIHFVIVFSKEFSTKNPDLIDTERKEKLHFCAVFVQLMSGFFFLLKNVFFEVKNRWYDDKMHWYISPKVFSNADNDHRFIKPFLFSYVFFSFFIKNNILTAVMYYILWYFTQCTVKIY